MQSQVLFLTIYLSTSISSVDHPSLPASCPSISLLALSNIYLATLLNTITHLSNCPQPNHFHTCPLIFLLSHTTQHNHPLSHTTQHMQSTIYHLAAHFWLSQLGYLSAERPIYLTIHPISFLVQSHVSMHTSIPSYPSMSLFSIRLCTWPYISLYPLVSHPKSKSFALPNN
jgi:hypothetical protein